MLTAERQHGRLDGKRSFSPRLAMSRRHPLTLLPVLGIPYASGHTPCQRGPTRNALGHSGLFRQGVACVCRKLLQIDADDAKPTDATPNWIRCQHWETICVAQGCKMFALHCAIPSQNIQKTIESIDLLRGSPASFSITNSGLI